ncbi:MAG: TIGR02921 family PEP-CTERM protein [Anaerolineae bacterium]|nr:TIGR02921 family PEP-CTERM protein [Anaerolineae bacterium]
MRKLLIFGRKLVNAKGWGYGLFWSWNLIFLAFMALGFAPQVLPEMITAVRTGTVPAAYLVYAVILTLIPLVAVILGATVLRRSPGRLLQLGYGVEGPVMLLVALRFFVVRELTPAVTLLLVIAGLGMATLLWQILDRGINSRGQGLTHLRLAGLTLLLLTGLYVGIWLAFYVLPFTVFAWDGLGEMWRSIPEIWDNLKEAIKDPATFPWLWIPFWVLGFILLVYTATLFIAMPLAVPILYFRAWRQGTQTFGTRYSWPRALILVAVVIIACVSLLIPANRQPQQRAFALLETPPATPAEAQALLKQQEAIRAGLLNAYLAPLRYFSAVGEVFHVSAMYESTFDMPPQQSARIQRAYETVAWPVLYAPVNPSETGEKTDLWARRRWENRALNREPRKAAELYESFFDQTIIDGERESVVRAVRSTWSIEQAETGWQAVDDREVLLTRQELTVTEHGDWADLELYEVYQNQTGQRQEVVYYFSLPESAVVTGVWLGNSPDRAERFTYRVSPRGAAQAIYRNEVRYFRDPALLEQIGPRQYRLRIFPIESKQMRWDEDRDRSFAEEGPPLHMWLTWRVLAKNNAWPLPQLADRRNVYWDDSSVRLLNGQPLAVDESNWLPESVSATAVIQPVAHRVNFPGGETVIVQPVTASDLPEPARNLRLAVVLDRSHSMTPYADQVAAALDQLRQVASAGAAIEVYLTVSEFRGEQPARVSLAKLEPDQLMYYGGQNAAELLVQYASLRTNQAYDAVFVLTDGTGYKLDDSELDVPLPDAPVWMVHLDGNFPLGYDDATLETIQASGGGVATSLDEALLRLTIARQGGLSHAPAGALSDAIDGYAWLTFPPQVSAEADPAVVTHSSDDGFAALAARRLILTTMQNQRTELDRLNVLDHIHEIAIEHSIVTPYSSMIVLVNERQEKLLDKLEKQNDRFLREYEDVGETAPEDVVVTGVPEPEEWLLLALAGGMLGWYVYARRRGSQRYGTS